MVGCVVNDHCSNPARDRIFHFARMSGPILRPILLSLFPPGIKQSMRVADVFAAPSDGLQNP
jgi:hypothetical protein